MPLLGMIVDRSSFDDDETMLPNVRSRSIEEEDGDENSKRTSSGKVKRKLKWKPQGVFGNRSQRQQKYHSPSSAESVSLMSSKTSLSNGTFHTNHSSETQKIGNISKPATLERKRRQQQHSLHDLVEEDNRSKHQQLATIDTEGHFMERRRRRKKQQQEGNKETLMKTPERSDFEVIDDTVQRKTLQHSKNLNVYPRKRQHVVDPNVEFTSSSKSIQLPPRRPLPSTPPPRSRTTTSSALIDDVVTTPGTPSTINTTLGDIACTSFEGDGEDQRGPDKFRKTITQLSEMSDADAAAGFAISSSTTTSNERLRSTIETPTKQSVEEEPVPATVSPTLNLDSPSNIQNILTSSALLNGIQYVPKISLSTTSYKSIDSCLDVSISSKTQGSSTAGSSSMGISIIDDDDSSLSAQSSLAKSSNNIRHDTRSSADHGSTQSQSGRKTKSRRRTSNNVPVDVDEATFVEAEHNLRAIHLMAAEHMAHGEYEEALEVFVEILRGQYERFGKSSFQVGTALHNIGIVYLKSGQYHKAIKICQESVKIRKDTLVPNHPDIAVSLAQLGVAYLECRAHRNALISFREALSIRRQSLGKKHPKVAKILNNIGCALFELDEFRGATLALEEALEIQRDTLRTIAKNNSDKLLSSPYNQILLSISSTLCNISSIKVESKRLEEASLDLEEALLIQQSVLGDEHPTVLKTIESISYLDKAMGESTNDDIVEDARGYQFPYDSCHKSSLFDMIHTETEESMGAFKKMNWKSISQSLGLQHRQLYQKINDDLAVNSQASLTTTTSSGRLRFEI